MNSRWIRRTSRRTSRPLDFARGSRAGVVHRAALALPIFRPGHEHARFRPDRPVHRGRQPIEALGIGLSFPARRHVSGAELAGRSLSAPAAQPAQPRRGAHVSRGCSSRAMCRFSRPSRCWPWRRFCGRWKSPGRRRSSARSSTRGRATFSPLSFRAITAT